MLVFNTVSQRAESYLISEKIIAKSCEKADKQRERTEQRLECFTVRHVETDTSYLVTQRCVYSNHA